MQIQQINKIQNANIAQNKTSPLPKTAKNTYSVGNTVLNSLSFLGNYNTPIIRELIDIPVKDDKEFAHIMNRVRHAKVKPKNKWQAINPFRKRVWVDRRYKKTFPEYTKATEIEMGLIPYCGQHDNSLIINMLLSGRLENINSYSRIPKNDAACVDVIRALDYSLKKLDEEYGKYQGIVYRVGHMEEDCGQYFSTSKSLVLAKRKRVMSYNFDKSKGYSVIRLKNGHKIYEFQEKMGSNFAESEEEVLTDRSSKFKKLKPEEMDKELLEAREKLAQNLFYGADSVMVGKGSDYYKFSRDDLLSFVDVYEEI